ncbi:chemotaxis protein CheW [Peptococcaceae bacterium]|nr:chemotaxis protein CheW [Peptococcaceae bacterium]
MSTDTMEQVVVFKLGDQDYALDIMAVKEIIRMEKITKIPAAPDFIEGIISLRGSMIPIVDLSKRFGISGYDYIDNSDDAAVNSNKRIIVLQVKETVFGIIVDAVQEVMSIPENSLEPPPEVVSGTSFAGVQIDIAYLKGIAKVNDRLIILIDHNRILYGHETEELQQMAM